MSVYLLFRQINIFQQILMKFGIHSWGKMPSKRVLNIIFKQNRRKIKLTIIWNGRLISSYKLSDHSIIFTGWCQQHKHARFMLEYVSSSLVHSLLLCKTFVHANSAFRLSGLYTKKTIICYFCYIDLSCKIPLLRVSQISSESSSRLATCYTYVASIACDTTLQHGMSH